MDIHGSDNKHELKMGHYVFWGAALAYAGVAFVYAFLFGSGGLGGTEEFARFGDYIGGVVNPLLGLLTIFLLVRSLKVQSEELKLSRQELANSASEMAKSNDLMKVQSLIQIRVQSRLQVGEYFALVLTSYSDFLTNYNIRIGLHGHSASFKEIINAYKGGLAPGIYIPQIVAGFEDVNESDFLPKLENIKVAKITLRKEVDKVIEVARSLIFLTDNDIMVKVVEMKVSALLNDLQIVSFFTDDEITCLRDSLTMSIQLRRGFTDVPFSYDPL